MTISTRFLTAMAFSLLALWVGATSSLAARVNMMRILREHRVTVVSTEPAAKLAKHFLDWGVNVEKVLTFAQLLAEKDRLPGDGDVLFIIDRTKERGISTLERQLLPLPAGAIEPNSVLTFVSKTGYRRGQRYKNGWDILISAPDEKWLQKTLKIVPTILGREVDERAPVKLYDFAISRLLIVSNAGRDLAQNWADAQFNPNRAAVDWEFVPLDLWQGDSYEERDILFILSTARMIAPPPELLDEMPKDVKMWLAGSTSKTEAVACRESAPTDSGTRSTRYAIVAPSERHLQQSLKQYPSTEAIPDTLARRKFADLRGYNLLAIAVRTADRSPTNGLELNEFAAKLTSELTARVTGFTCSTQQDLLETGYAEALAAQSAIDSVQAEEIHARTNAQALVVLDLSAVTKETSFHSNEPVRMTSLLPPFSEPEPRRPSPPDPEASVLFRGKKYRLVEGDRRNDPRYKADYSAYEEALRDFPNKLYRWERARDSYESQRNIRMIDWEVSLDAVQRTQVAGNLRVYDMRPGSSTIGKLEYAQAVSGGSSRHTNYKTERVTVRGEMNRPPGIFVPAMTPQIADFSLVSEAFQDACARAAESIIESSILPADVK